MADPFGTGDPTQYGLGLLNTQPAETTVGPEKLVARTDKEAASQALGKPLPVVIGTGRVEGIYFIGGVTQIDTTTTTKTWTVEDITEVGGGIYAGQVNYAGAGGAGLGLHALPIYTAVESSTVTTETTTRAGYVLAYDFFEVGYDLIRLEIDGKTVFDGETGEAATQTFRFYGGQHAGADPILSQIIGENAGAYKNFVMLFLDGYPAERAPSISCVISNGTTDSEEEVEIQWTGSTPFTAMTQNEAGRAAAYEPGSGLIYQVFPVGTMLYLAVLDSYTFVERYRVPLQGTEGWESRSRWVMCLRGTGHILLRVAQGGVFQTNRIYDVDNGHIVAEHNEIVDVEAYLWAIGQRFGDRYMLVGNDTLAATWIYGLVDISAGTFIAGPVGVTTELGAHGALTYGISGAGSISFFGITSFDHVMELTFDGDSWSARTCYTSGGQINAIWFDPLTGYLVVSESVSSVAYIRYVNPATGATIDSFTTGVLYHIFTFTFSTGRERYWPRTGFVMLTKSTADPGQVWLLDILSKTISLYAENTSITVLNFNTGIFDQNRRVWIEGIGDDVWTVHLIPNSAPRLMDLQDVVTDVMSLAGFTPGDLTFEGFDGIQTWGFVINSNTTIQSAMRTLADIYSFSWCDTGSGFYFKRAATGDLLTVDAALTTDDIVERPQPVQSSDEADIRTPSMVELDYVSKEGQYKPRPVSFSMTTGVLDSITTPRLSTPILLNDNEAQRICIEKFFEYQEKRRSHGLVVTPEFIEILPGDIVSFPSGSISYTARVEQVGVDLRNMGVELLARDYQTEVETTVTSVSNQVSLPGSVFFTSQYIHLDMPLYRYADDTLGASVIQYGVLAPRGQALWSGARLLRGSVVSALTLLFQQMPHQGIVGSCTTVLAAPADPFVRDDVSTLTIRRLTNDDTLLTSATEAEVEAGTNNALVGEPGRWEWIGYEDVTDNGDGTYTLSGFTMRGYRGSEVFCGLHEVGDVFVTLGPWVRKVQHPVTDLGDTLYYKAVGIGQEPTNVSAVPHIITGTAETPYAPVNLDAVVGTPNGIDISWDYRSRLATGLNPAAYGEVGGLAFEIDIYDTDGTTYLRTLATATNSVHYPTASVVADFGADPPDELYFRVYMMSALDLLVPGQDRPIAGRGYEAQGHVALGGGFVILTGQSLTASVGSVTVSAAGGGGVTASVSGQAMTVSVGNVTVSTGAGGGILDGTSPTAAWSMSRDLLSSFTGGTRYTTATGVDSLKDQTGNARHLNANIGANEPAVVTAGPNSRACADFDGSDDFLIASAMSNFIANNAAYMIVSFLADTITLNASAQYTNHILIGDSSGYIGMFLRNIGTPDRAYAYNYDGTEDVAVNDTVNAGTAYVLELRHEGGNLYVRLNGGTWSAATASGNTQNVGTNLCMGGGGTNGKLDGKIFEAATWSTIPSSGTQDTIAAAFKSWVGA